MKSQAIRSLCKSLVFILLLTGLFILYLLFKPGNSAWATLVDNLIQGLLEGVGLLLTLPLFLQRHHRRRPAAESSPSRSAPSPTTQRWVSLLLGLGILSYLIGQTLWTYNENIAHLAVLFPSWADAGFLGSYPFVLLAILLLPSRALPAGTRTRIVLDGLMIMVGIVTFSWYFLLGPTILQGADTVIGQMIGMAYPLTTLVLIFCLLLLFASTHDREIRLVVLILSLALFILVTTDSVYDFQQLHTLYQTGTLLDVGWPLGYMLVGLGARLLQVQLAAHPLSSSHSLASGPSEQMADPPRSARSLWRSLMPYFSVPAVILLLVLTTSFGGKGMLEAGVYVGITVLMVLLLLRQILATQQIERAYQEQRHLNEVKGQLFTHINHELRSPLTTIYGSLQILKEGREAQGPLSETFQVECLDRAIEGCECLILLTNQVLEATYLSRDVTPPHPEELCIAQVVQKLLEHGDPRIMQVCHVSVDLHEHVRVWADRKLLSQILWNLLSNVSKYCPAQTPVLISAVPSEQETPLPSSPPTVCIRVKDSGPGIPPAELPHLFAPFARLKRDVSMSIPGSGLGLYISKQMVQAMGGQMWAESSGVAGEGSCFSLTLPAAAPDGESVPD